MSFAISPPHAVRCAAAGMVLALSLPCVARSCDGTAGRDVATTFDGQKFTVSNMGRQWLQVVFTAGNATYNLQLAPGQSASPRSAGTFGQFMTGYQSCAATPIRYR
ncbi:MAG TPA: hypothetical protein VHY79_10690 [Rhizomicrobium sp.]|nr:hypothetical protein [Rhizomicrobium sp.]